MHIKTWRYGWVFAVAAACACAAFAATVMLVPNPYISEGILRIRTTEARDDTATPSTLLCSAPRAAAP